MKHLTQLIAPYIANDRLISAVGRYCSRLELLDISGTEDVTDEGIKSLYRNNIGGELWPADLIDSLKYLMIGGPGGKRLEPATVAQLLIKLPHLISLGSYPHTGTAISKVCI